MRQLQAVLIGQSYELTTAVLPLLKRANFEVDLILINSRCDQFCLCRNIYFVELHSQLAALLLELSADHKYDVVVVGDDETLLDILKLDISENLKEKFLPISSLDKVGHLYSKVGLSKIFRDFNIETPPFEAVLNSTELVASVNRIGYPLMVKVDSSGGGAGVFECHSISDVLDHQDKYSYPLLVQKWIEGDTLDLSALYQDGQLIHFTYSKFVKVIGNMYGPSSVRRYWQLACVERAIFDELQALGCALEADGFVNVTAIDSRADGKRYYFEADMRPNVWADYGRFIGNDAAIALREYFISGRVLGYPQTFNPLYPESTLIPYYRRLSLIDILLNRYRCWDYISEDRGVCGFVITITFHKIVSRFARIIKPYIPKSIWLKMRPIYLRYVGI